MWDGDLRVSPVGVGFEMRQDRSRGTGGEADDGAT
jgi:hypothetical protein